MLEPTHLIADLVCFKGLDSAFVVESFMRSCIAETGLTIRHIWVEEFTNGGEFGPGITGIAVLSESNMTVHTAPDRNCLNLDLFSCKPFLVDEIRAQLHYSFGEYEINRWEILRR
tara:strand:- start:83 stop:427 length:345 start_codon:yes stop_codon:yes gene_type:complete